MFFSKKPIFIDPWNEDKQFLSILSPIQDRIIYTRRKMYMLYQLARLAPEGLGAEVGSYRGATAYLLSKTLKGTLRAFDTFEGMPEVSLNDLHKQGDFSDVGDTIEFLKANGIEVHKGFFPDTAVDGKYSFVHIDVDIYQSVKDCLAFFVPRLVTGGIIVSDDYGVLTCPGAKKAWDEFFTKPTLYLPTGQAVYINV